MIDLRYVKKLIEIIDESTVDSIEISSDKGMKIRISKSPTGRGGVQVAAPVMAPMMAAPSLPAGRMTPAEGIMLSDDSVRPEKNGPAGTEVKSPMVGTYYGAPEPGAKPYVAIGSRVSKGQILCIIEAMKIMNEIDADKSGTVTSILCDNGQAVEFGQSLFIIE